MSKVIEHTSFTLIGVDFNCLQDVFDKSFNNRNYYYYCLLLQPFPHMTTRCFTQLLNSYLVGFQGINPDLFGFNRISPKIPDTIIDRDIKPAFIKFMGLKQKNNLKTNSIPVVSQLSNVQKNNK